MGESPVTRVSRSSSINIPICNSCKKGFFKEKRKEGSYLFGILFPFTWMILLFALIQPSFMKNLESVFASGFGGTLLFIFWILLFILNIGGISLLIDPKSIIDWPVKLEKPPLPKKDNTPNPNFHIFSFTNSAYAKLFWNANINRLYWG